MRRENVLAEGKKFPYLLYIKEIAKSKTTKSIAERVNRHTVTEIGDSDKIVEK